MSKNKTTITVEPGKQELFITREFDAPRELVFRAYTDPKIRREALGLAEEALPLDNEGLRVAESRGRYAATSVRRRGKRRR